MAYDPVALVEVLEPCGEHPARQWVMKMQVARLVAEAYGRRRVFADLFGYPEPPDDKPAIAHNRGFPLDLSFQSRWEYEHTSRSNRGEKWILWTELKEYDLLHAGDGNIQKEWWIIFDILRAFAQCHGDNGVRLIIWWAK